MGLDGPGDQSTSEVYISGRKAISVLLKGRACGDAGRAVISAVSGVKSPELTLWTGLKGGSRLNERRDTRRRRCSRVRGRADGSWRTGQSVGRKKHTRAERLCAWMGDDLRGK